MRLCPICKLYLKELFIFTIALYIILFLYPIKWYIIFFISAIPFITSIFMVSSFFSLINLIIPLIIFSYFTDNIFTLYLPFITYFLITISVRSGRKWSYILSITYVILWIILSFLLRINIADIILILSSLLTIAFSLPILKGNSPKSNNIDIIYKSDTGNTLKVVKKFAAGMYDANNGDISISDFNSYNYNNSIREFDAIVVSFPIHFFGSGRSFLYKIYKNLPKGNGKNAFILYTGSFYDDMASLIIWLILIFKGYNVRGRLFISTILQKSSLLEEKVNNIENKIIYETGGDFVDGWYCGIPLLIIPSPLFLLTFLKK